MKTNRKIIVGIFLGLLCITAVGCGMVTVKNNKDNNNEIILETNGGVPYEWKYSIDDESIVKFNSKDSISDDELAGGKVELHYYFKGLKKGTTTIKFEYVNFVNDEVEKTKNYEAVVDADLNLNITEK